MKKTLRLSPSFGCSVVENYRAVFIPVYMGGGSNHLVAIRAFEDEAGCTHFLSVDTHTFETCILISDRVNYRDVSGEGSGYINYQTLQATPYMRALTTYTQPPYVLQNQGLIHGETRHNHGAFMTVDLCPSVRPFEQAFFERLIATQTYELPDGVPVAISISGLWLLAHQQEFNWLLDQAKLNNLSITWVNHSYTHLYFPDIPFEDNFLNWPGTLLDNELLELERLLLVQGELPSVFIRLPGLVSNEKVILHIKQLGLIPLGADAWLAKGETVQDSSIVLVHGNGNEPKGIALALPLLDQWAWLDLKKAFKSG